MNVKTYIKYAEYKKQIKLDEFVLHKCEHLVKCN